MKAIPGFSGYQISEAGLIRNMRGQNIVPARNQDGDPFVRLLDDDGNLREVLVSELLAAAFPPVVEETDQTAVKAEETPVVAPEETKPTGPKSRKTPAKDENETS